MNKFTWEELLAADPQTRLSMWQKLKEKDPDTTDYWEDCFSCCEDAICNYLRDGWCEYMELPCAVNPYLTPRTGMVGMACMGMPPPQQMRLF